MVKHIVMWQLKDEALGKNKRENLEIMREMLLSLEHKIPEIKTIAVGINDKMAVPENFDIALIMDFESFATLETYQKHPEHQKIVAFVKGVRQLRAAVDYVY